MLLYETLSQPKVFFVILLVGFSSGIIFDLCAYLHFLCNKNRIIRIILDIISTLLLGIIFFFIVLNQNYGELRFYEFLAFISGILIERKTLGLIIAKLCSWCYNRFKIIISKIQKLRIFNRDDRGKSQTTG